MDAAIYEPTSNSIWGVRGQWLFNFNSTNGAFINQYQFTKDAQSQSSIAAMGGSLYVGVSAAKYIDAANSPGSFLNRDIFRINPANGQVISQFNWGNKLDAHANNGADTLPNPACGWYNLTPAGTLLFGFLFGNPDFNQQRAFNVVPSPLGAISLDSSGSTGSVNDIAYDSFNNVIWVASVNFQEIYAVIADGTWGSSCASAFQTLYPMGICYNAAQNKVYAVTGTGQILMVIATAAVPGFNPNFAVTTLNTGQGNCNAWRIRSVNNLPGNPLNGKVLIPSLVDGNILVWDPALDTIGSMVIKTGFTAPFDIVVCPTANFALQSGTTGLKQIV